MKIVEPILKDDRIIPVSKKELPLVTPVHAIGLDTNLYTLDGVSIYGEEVHVDIKDQEYIHVKDLNEQEEKDSVLVVEEAEGY